MGVRIHSVYVSPDHSRIAVRVVDTYSKESWITEYDPSDSDGYDVDVLDASWQQLPLQGD